MTQLPTGHGQVSFAGETGPAFLAYNVEHLLTAHRQQPLCTCSEPTVCRYNGQPFSLSQAASMHQQRRRRRTTEVQRLPLAPTTHHGPQTKPRPLAENSCLRISRPRQCLPRRHRCHSRPQAQPSILIDPQSLPVPKPLQVPQSGRSQCLQNPAKPRIRQYAPHPRNATRLWYVWPIGPHSTKSTGTSYTSPPFQTMSQTSSLYSSSPLHASKTGPYSALFPAQTVPASTYSVSDTS